MIELCLNYGKESNHSVLECSTSLSISISPISFISLIARVSYPFKFLLLLDFLRVLKMNSLESAQIVKQRNVNNILDSFLLPYTALF